MSSLCACVWLWGCVLKRLRQGRADHYFAHRLNARNVRYAYGQTTMYYGPAKDPDMLDFDWTLLRWSPALQERGAKPLPQTPWQMVSEDTVPFASRPGNSADSVSISKWRRHPSGAVSLGRRTESSVSLSEWWSRFSDSGKEKLAKMWWNLLKGSCFTLSGALQLSVPQVWMVGELKNVISEGKGHALTSSVNDSRFRSGSLPSGTKQSCCECGRL